MSVINRMLRDLDQRQQHQSKGSYTPAAVAPQPLHWTWMIGIAVGTAVIIVLVLTIYWWFTTDTHTNVVIKEPEVAVIESDKGVVERRLESTPEAAAEAQVDLDSAAESMAADPQEPTLQRGPVKPREVAQVPATAELPATATDMAAPASDPGLNEVVAATLDDQPELEVQLEESPTTFEVERVQLTPTELAESNLQKARSALRRGDRELGQELLEKALIVMPEHVAVRSELAAYWYGRGFATRAVAILQQGLDLIPQQSQWQLLLGRILERMGRIEDAYLALQSIDSSTAEYPGLLEVRGNAANQLGSYSEAAQDFLTLASLTNEGRWWLAAAVAFEDAGESTAALRAYQQAAFANDLGADARTYAENRLQALGGS
ncbi:MAG TPA: hypothetical protein VFM61_04350 [Pseudidiomarina sp.]|nr:hypothetical protein [Pseudidiomarina sp.]